MAPLPDMDALKISADEALTRSQWPKARVVWCDLGDQLYRIVDGNAVLTHACTTAEGAWRAAADRVRKLLRERKEAKGG